LHFFLNKTEFSRNRDFVKKTQFHRKDVFSDRSEQFQNDWLFYNNSDISGKLPVSIHCECRFWQLLANYFSQGDQPASDTPRDSADCAAPDGRLETLSRYWTMILYFTRRSVPTKHVEDELFTTSGQTSGHHRETSRRVADCR
jgi:hypothetical protein